MCETRAQDRNRSRRHRQQRAEGVHFSPSRRTRTYSPAKVPCSSPKPPLNEKTPKTTPPVVEDPPVPTPPDVEAVAATTSVQAIVAANPSRGKNWETAALIAIGAIAAFLFALVMFGDIAK